MRTNIDIDDTLMDAALRAGPFKTKKDAVEAGLRLVARQAAYREILRWEGRLQWDGDAPDEGTASQRAALRTGPGTAAPALAVQEPPSAGLEPNPHPHPRRRHGRG